jgi:hypothetical protein
MIEDSAAKALAATPVAAPAVTAAATPAAAEAAPTPKPNVLKNMALFLVAPFIGLLYAVLLPFVGIGMLAWMAFKRDDRGSAARPE